MAAWWASTLPLPDRDSDSSLVSASTTSDDPFQCLFFIPPQPHLSFNATHAGAQGEHIPLLIPSGSEVRRKWLVQQKALQPRLDLGHLGAHSCYTEHKGM